MRKTARAGGTAPSSPSSTLPLRLRLPRLSAGDPAGDGAPFAPHRRRTALAGAGAAFAAALLLAGAACALALGVPAPFGFDGAALIVGALSASAAATGLGVVLALRDRGQQAQRQHRTTRAEQIQRELDALDLTPREMAVAQLILQHRSYRDIAEACHLSVRTVQFHASNAFHKAYVSRRRDFERIMLADPATADQPAGPFRGGSVGATGGEPYERIPRLRPDLAPTGGLDGAVGAGASISDARTLGASGGTLPPVPGALDTPGAPSAPSALAGGYGSPAAAVRRPSAPFAAVEAARGAKSGNDWGTDGARCSPPGRGRATVNAMKL